MAKAGGVDLELEFSQAHKGRQSPLHLGVKTAFAYHATEPGLRLWQRSAAIDAERSGADQRHALYVLRPLRFI